LVTLSWAVFDWYKRGKTAAQYEPIKRRIKALLEQAQQGGCKSTASNLLGQWATLWLFTTRADVAPTNNAAERAIHTLVLKAQDLRPGALAPGAGVRGARLQRGAKLCAARPQRAGFHHRQRAVLAGPSGGGHAIATRSRDGLSRAPAPLIFKH
jgi:hypothetical protein